MDPASIVGLVAACATLVKTCGGVVKLLHKVAKSYSDAELSILSVIEECESIKFAWSRLEAWTIKNIHGVEDHDELLERLRKSLYNGQLVMTALEEDLIKAVPKTGAFRRRAWLTWNENAFQVHQTRIRGQLAALQLLLQVVSM
jgi:hypothetical protein